MRAIFLLGAMLTLTTTVAAESPQMINYQGRLTDAGGVPQDTAIDIIFTICNDSIGSNNLWGETHAGVEVVDGLFNITLGADTALSAALFSESERWLHIQIGNDPGESMPPTRLITVPYAFHADRSDTASVALAVPDGSIMLSNIAQDGALAGQVIKWNGSTWAPAEDLNDGAGSSGWTVIDSVIFTNDYWGIARGQAENALNGDNIRRASMINFGVACTTGAYSDSDLYIGISAGTGNRAEGNYAYIGGGRSNRVINNGGFIGGGASNNIAGEIHYEPYEDHFGHNVICGGFSNYINDNFSGNTTICGGRFNSITAPDGFIGGGSYNDVQGIWGTIVGGFSNQISDGGSYHSFIGGGLGNQTTGSANVIVGGEGNQATGYMGGSGAEESGIFIGGGWLNTADGYLLSIPGGGKNYISGGAAVIGGGFADTIDYGYASVIAGGQRNIIRAGYSAILGGYHNTIHTGADYSYLFGIESDLYDDSTFMVDMPHIDLYGSIRHRVPGWTTMTIDTSYQGAGEIWIRGLTTSQNVMIGDLGNAPDCGAISVHGPANGIGVGMRANPNGTGMIYVRGATSGNVNVQLTYDNSNVDHGRIRVCDASSTAQAGIYVDASGDGIVWGDNIATKTPHPDRAETDIVYACLEGPEAAAYLRGTARLVNGRAEIDLPDHFRAVIVGDGITVQLTPLSADSRGLACTHKNTDRIEIVELYHGTGNYDFDYTVTAVRKGHEDFQVIRSRPKEPVEPELKPPYKPQVVSASP